MSDLYPEIEPYQSGWLDVDGGNRIYWEVCGNPQGKSALVVHGGPGSGCTPRQRRLFDPNAYRIVLFDQRNCGRSTPHASALDCDLASNNTANLVADMERLRQHLGIERWLLFGGSWGSTLSLAYAVAYSQRVSEMILFGVTTGRRSEIDWLFRGGVSIFFPEQWDRLCSLIPVDERGDIVAAYARRLNDPDMAVRQRAADAWCLWESATPDWPPATGLAERFASPPFALAFARIVTHYMVHNLWLEEGGLLPQADRLTQIPTMLINGRYDFQAPIGDAWELKRVLPQADLTIVDNAGHGGMTVELVGATDRFATA